MIAQALQYLIRRVDAEIKLDCISRYHANDSFDFNMGCLDAPALIPNGECYSIQLYSDTDGRMHYGAAQKCMLRDGEW